MYTHCQILTEVEGHANEDYEAKPGIEIGYKIDNGDDNVSDGGEDAEHDVAVGINQIKPNINFKKIETGIIFTVKAHYLYTQVCMHPRLIYYILI